MIAYLVAAVAAYAFFVIGLHFVSCYGEGFCWADADTFAAQLALFRVEDRTFYCQVFDQAESPFRHIVSEHGGIVQMPDQAVVVYKKLFCFLQRIDDFLARL